MSDAVVFRHPYTGDLVTLVQVDLRSADEVRIHFKSKGQRGRFKVHINEDGSSTPAIPDLEVTECHI